LASDLRAPRHREDAASWNHARAVTPEQPAPAPLDLDHRPGLPVSPIGRDATDKTRALGYFQTFLELLVDQLTEQLDELLGERAFLERVTGQRRRMAEQALELMVRLLDLATRGAPVSAFSESSYDDEQIARSERSGAQSGSIGIEAGQTPRARASMGLSYGSSRLDAATSTAHTTSGAVPRFALVRRTLLELLELLKIERLNILIDEWSLLDPSGATAIQPEFAELLKRTFQGARGISVKVATNRYQTRFSNRGAGGGYRGLQIDADIFAATNLDRAMLDRESLVSFYESLLFKRLALGEEELRRFDSAGDGLPDGAFVLSIFRDRRAFRELVKGAEGIPRDFLVLFNSVARENRHSVADRWSAVAIQDVIRQRSIMGQDDIEFRSVTSQLVDPCIRAVVGRTRSRIFFVSREHYVSIQDALEELLEKRLIHDYPTEGMPAFARQGHRAYLVDYGLWLDWDRTRIGDEVTHEESSLPANEGEFSDWQVDPSSIEREDRLTCPHCGNVFTVDEAAYVRKRLCPLCFEKVDDAVAPERAGSDGI
jgi:hypothetical protein